MCRYRTLPPSILTLIEYGMTYFVITTSQQTYSMDDKVLYIGLVPSEMYRLYSISTSPAAVWWARLGLFKILSWFSPQMSHGLQNM